MTLGASTKSNPSANKIDETELERLRKQDYWLVVTRNKLLLDLVFVCKFSGAKLSDRVAGLPAHSIRLLQREARENHSAIAGGLDRCLFEVRGSFVPLCPGVLMVSSARKLFAKESAALAKTKT
jgi:hypothetical protein